jgi:hypothetical protein
LFREKYGSGGAETGARVPRESKDFISGLARFRENVGEIRLANITITRDGFRP